MEIKLYTEQECEFLDKCLNLFEVKADVTKVKDVIKATTEIEVKQINIKIKNIETAKGNN